MKGTIRMRQFRTLAVSLVAACFLVPVAGCSGADGLDGPPGKDGVDGTAADPSVSAISPSRVFLERTLDVSISGFGTTWTEAAKVDFGAGVKINSMRVASPTALILNITVSAEAPTGPRDVTVTEGDAASTFKGAFDVLSPLDLEVLGSAAQGSILLGSARQLDLASPFDTTTEGDGLFSPISYPNVSIEAGAGLFASIENVSLYSVDFLAFVDVDAAAGKADLTVHSGSGDNVVSSSSAIEIAARAPAALGATASGSISAPLETALYKYTASADKFVTIKASSSKSGARPAFVLLPASGKFAEMFGYGVEQGFTATSGQSFYVVYWDQTGTTGSFDLAVEETTPVAEVEPNGTCAEAQALTSGAVVNASLETEADVDWFKIEVPAGKKVRASTFPGDEDTDTALELYGTDCTTKIGSTVDQDYHETLTSGALATAGTYYVKVAASSYGSEGEKYVLRVTLE